MEEVDIPQFSVFLRHGNIQRRESEWGGSHFEGHSLYLTSEDVDLPDVMPLAYEDSIRACLIADVLSVQ